MNTFFNIYRLKNKMILIFIPLLFLGCEDFLEIDDPTGQIPHNAVFEDKATATAAVTSLYAKLRDEVLLTGKPSGLSFIMGIYSDEMDYYGYGGDLLDAFYQHHVVSTDLVVQSIWDGSYQVIYMSNGILEGLNNSQSLDAETKAQLRGEALFVRSLVYFYLTDLFGDIPFPTSTDYEINKELSKTQQTIIYENILSDLQEAKGLVSESYITGERTRANKGAISALLSRLFFYLNQWENANTESSEIINNSALYGLETDLSLEFLKESRSAILQIDPKYNGDNTEEGLTFIFSFGPPPLVSLNPSLVEDMELGDLRKVNWIGEVTDGTSTWYYPQKYKQDSNTGESLEYSIVFRLAEQYLIRAEARARIGELNGAKSDLNVIRNRAGLSDTQANTLTEIIEAIFTENRFEMLAEHGSRWFNIKRLGLANEILSPIKQNWKLKDLLFPIPESELLMNPNLNPQNPGY